MSAALSVEALSVAFRGPGGDLPVLRGLSLHVPRGGSLGLVGESGCGKSTLALAILRALPEAGRIAGGRVRVGGQDVAALGAASLREMWARRVSMVYQDPGRALNPTMTIGAQVSECYAVLGASRAEARARAARALDSVRIAAPSRVMAAYPHQISGGMQQRVVIAMALAKQPELLVLDEPTTGLDATVEAEILDLIATLRQESGTAILVISHAMRVVARLAEEIAVLYAGAIVEQGPAAFVLQQPRHPYTARLLRCMPRDGVRRRDRRLETIPGQPPAADALPAGCLFAPRCVAAADLCHARAPAMRGGLSHRGLCHFDPPFAASAVPDHAAPSLARDARPVLEAQHLAKSYGAAPVLRGVDFTLRAGETLGIIGESGSGKTTLARLLLGLVPPDAESVIAIDGAALAFRLKAREGAQKRAIQMVFQNPGSALNRGRGVRRILARPLRRLAKTPGEAALHKLAAQARLGAAELDARPGALSGGQKQRVAIARALAARPRVLICDEPTSALDASVQSAILNLLADVQREEGLALVFISHDLNVVRYMADRVLVLYRGEIVESGPVDEVFANQRHAYTRALLAAAGL